MRRSIDSIPDCQAIAILARAPFAAEMAPQEVRGPALLEPEDYAAMAALENTVSAPVLVNYSQHYRLLDDLVTTARAAFGENLLMILRYSGPYVLALPSSLLQPDVLLMHDPCTWASLHGQGRKLLLIEDHIRRDTVERSDNRVHVRAWQVDPDVFVAWFRGTRIYSSLRNISYAENQIMWGRNVA